METVLKQVLGVDVAQNELVVTFGRLTNDLEIDLVAHKVFKNTENGFCTSESHYNWTKILHIKLIN